MSVEENKALARRLYEEVWNQGNLDAATEVLAPTYVVHDPGTPGRPNGIEGEQQTASLYRTAFPDLHFTLEDVLAEGDEVAVRFTASGTQRGVLMGLAPTGKHATVTGISIFHVADGKITEHWVIFDALGLLQQLGAIPTPQSAGA